MEEPRPPRPLLGGRAPGAGGHTRCCGWCRRIDVGGGSWAEVEEAAAAPGLLKPAASPLTHGICEGCYTSIPGLLAAGRVRA